MKAKQRVLLMCGLTVSALSTTAMAYDLPPVNLGFTTFLDAAPPAGNGWYFSQYIQQYSARSLKGNNGDDLALPPTAKPDLDVTVSLTQGIYISEEQLFGGNLGLNVILPTVKADLNGIPAGVPLESANTGLGDLLVGPFIQWPPVMGPNGPKFFQRVELQIIMPTGEYSAKKEINPGSNFWSFNPYWSGTYFFTPELTASVRAHYLWNGKNDDPNRGFGTTAKDTRAGQAFHTNFAVEYAVTPQLRMGFNGYYLKQTTDTQMNGHDVNDRREQVLGLGVGGMYSFSKDNHLIFNYYDESHTKNRPEGERFNFRFVHHF